LKVCRVPVTRRFVGSRPWVTFGGFASGRFAATVPKRAVTGTQRRGPPASSKPGARCRALRQIAVMSYRAPLHGRWFSRHLPRAADDGHPALRNPGTLVPMLTARYMTSVKNVPAIMKAIQDGTAPTKFSVEHLKGLGFNSSGDRGIVPLLKDLKFLGPDGTPTQRYHDYRDKSRSKAVLADALRESYQDLFLINERPNEQHKAAIEGKFNAVHNVADNIAELQARTFFAFLKLADLDATPVGPMPKHSGQPKDEEGAEAPEGPTARQRHPLSSVGLRYNIEVHLPATKDVEVYNAIFKSLKEHLLDH
jgi:hypothetical protein